MTRTEIIQQIYQRLANLEKEMETTVVDSWRWNEIGVEMRALREKLQNVMNSPCPLLKDDN